MHQMLQLSIDLFSWCRNIETNLRLTGCLLMAILGIKFISHSGTLPESLNKSYPSAFGVIQVALWTGPEWKEQGLSWWHGLAETWLSWVPGRNKPSPKQLSVLQLSLFRDNKGYINVEECVGGFQDECTMSYIIEVLRMLHFRKKEFQVLKPIIWLSVSWLP